MSFLTDRARANNHGSAKEGADHWWQQRVTAVALVPLGLLFIFPFARALGSGYEAVIALYSHPLHAIVACLFILVAFNHMRLGLQVVIEDYVHGMIKTPAMLANIAFCGAFAFAGVFAIVRIAL
ncbi:MAG: succinate dehydrogenase, hydrophobic membrane anchor protein [Paracoccaceae bacterium]|jgi:succinate dehydrogenase / fumarate reductase membrane anchor subunit|nr:succinate dehydrogenase, hydrophobic membrane anchor protein [Paracoccaceae bacterium]MDG1369695.1 succinate dehydrogenase, hydrophobic membrane anchor protein [Paracoccaceae bacterium]MDG1969479.1 succinate dehydrogenase, hydrophobic membrane anchor protein [Paracoccaceae bacterium]